MSYYLIAIGGSGAKVLEAITHLCAAGIMPSKEKLYVMTIDPDIGNGNLARSSTAMYCYDVFQKVAIGRETELFKTPVEMANPFTWNPTEKGKCLDDVLSYQAYKGQPIGDLYEVLYTKSERRTLLDVGFRGHPSIGAAVMAKKIQFDGQIGGDAEPWNRFKMLVNQDAKSGMRAKIFLTGSVFGGTGAAGMPTIAKLMKNTFKELYEEGKVVIGGGLILPYFSFTPTNESELKGEVYALSENFLTSTQAALKYYSMKNQVEDIYHSMYFLGDDVLAPVKKFSIGASEQENDAHIIDLYAAFSMVDFFQTDTEKLKKCSYISRNSEKKFSWRDIPNIKAENVLGEVSPKTKMSQFIRFVFAYIHLIKPVMRDLSMGKRLAYKYPWFIDYLQAINIDCIEIKMFDKYTECFMRWLTQIQGIGSQNCIRNIELIHPLAIKGIEPASIDENIFAGCIAGDNSDVDINEVWYRLAEIECTDQAAAGFGKFLRVLYDCCEQK